jgi:hypothetical protein
MDASTTAMINHTTTIGVRAADIAALSQNRSKKAEPAPDTTVQTGQTSKPAHPSHPKGHIPPGLARAAESIASRIFSRADADASGTVTQEELSAVHSKHARILAVSDLFPAPTEAVTSSVDDFPDESTATSTDKSGETENNRVTDPTVPSVGPTPAGVTEEQLQVALAKFFYAKVGSTWAPPAAPAVEATDSAAPADYSTLPEFDPVAPESDANRTFTAVA